MKPDRFDILVLIAVTVLAAAAIFVGANAPADATVSRAQVARMAAEPPDPKVYAKLDAMKTLIESGQPDEALDTLNALADEHPAMSEPHALLGEAYSRLLDYPHSMMEYRRALMLEPGYVDKKSARFIGKRIKATVREGMAEAKAGLENKPQDAKAKAALKDAYYLERMLAGGCE